MLTDLHATLNSVPCLPAQHDIGRYERGASVIVQVVLVFNMGELLLLMYPVLC